MAITVNATYKPPEEAGYPQLMINKHTGEIVLVLEGFGLEMSGVILVGQTKERVGWRFERFDKRAFDVYNGTVTISNKT